MAGQWRCGALAAMVLLTAACSDSGPAGEAVVDDSVFADFADARVYRRDSPHAAALLDCARIARSDLSCTPARLPPLGAQSAAPDIDAIMDRVLVSHDWMGARFETLLGRLPADIRLLLRSTTAIIIDADIRPSFFWLGTGAIYLDPSYLWVSAEEKATISYEPDYRSDFGADLQFEVLWRYMDGGAAAYSWCGMGNADCSRTLDDIELPLARLLYHELAHANDYLPNGEIATLDPALSLYGNLVALRTRRVNRLLEDSIPLLSATLGGLAAVRFGGEEASEAQHDITPETVGSELHGDGAAAFYSYYSAAEDVAMLFEASMMKRNYGFDFLLGTTSRPGVEQPVCDDYIIGWGQTNRLAADSVSPRGQLVAAAILPDVDWDSAFANLGDNALLPMGVGWCSGVYRAGRSARGAALPEMEAHHPHAGWSERERLR